MCGQPCVPTAPWTASGLDNITSLWLTVAWRMQPWKAGRSAARPGTVTLSGGQREEQHVREKTKERGYCLTPDWSLWSIYILCVRQWTNSSERKSFGKQLCAIEVGQLTRCTFVKTNQLVFDIKLKSQSLHARQCLFWVWNEPTVSFSKKKSGVKTQKRWRRGLTDGSVVLLIQVMVFAEMVFGGNWTWGSCRCFTSHWKGCFSD